MPSRILTLSLPYTYPYPTSIPSLFISYPTPNLTYINYTPTLPNHTFLIHTQNYRGEIPRFQERDMPTFRERMMYEIAVGELLPV